MSRSCWGSRTALLLAVVLVGCGGTAVTDPGPNTDPKVTLTIVVDGGTSVQFYDGQGVLHKCGDSRVSGAPSQCTAQVRAGFEVDIQRTLGLPVQEEALWRLVSWGDACPVIDTDIEVRGGHCRIMMNTHQTVEVGFERRVRARILQNSSDPVSMPWAITMSAQKGGGNPLMRQGTYDCNFLSNSSDCGVDAYYDVGTVLSITAGSGGWAPWTFQGWRGACVAFNIGATCTLTLAADVDVTGEWGYW